MARVNHKRVKQLLNEKRSRITLGISTDTVSVSPISRT